MEWWGGSKVRVTPPLCDEMVSFPTVSHG